MKKINEQIILYLSGNLTDVEQSKLEREIENSGELKEQLSFCKEKLKTFKAIPNDDYLNEIYFQNLIPRMRNRLKPSKKRSLIIKFAYSLPVLIILTMVLYFNYGKSNGFDKMVTELPESYATQIVDQLVQESEDYYNQINLDTNSVEIINSDLLNQLDLAEKINSSGITFSTDELNENLTTEEINEIYSEMLKTKLL